MSEFFESYESPEPSITLVIEDDGRVAYGYLLAKKEVVGDVWLYNQAETPIKPEWKDESKAPFLNPSDYVVQPLGFTPLVSSEEVRIAWTIDKGGTTGVQIFIREQLHATMFCGEKPGASRFARKGGPLAKVLLNP